MRIINIAISDMFFVLAHSIMYHVLAWNSQIKSSVILIITARKSEGE